MKNTSFHEKADIARQVVRAEAKTSKTFAEFEKNVKTNVRLKSLGLPTAIIKFLIQTDEVGIDLD